MNRRAALAGIISGPIAALGADKVSGVSADTKMLIINFPLMIDGMSVEVDADGVHKELEPALKAAGLGDVQVVLLRGADSVTAVK